ncbi:MAG: NADH:ubiquinone oxidoreductase subunit [Gammaproteobacteria bacterium]|jgi:NADH-quinone oxidoreductase subunit L|nr:NADH:ubiquinone oxidoreductase subunit [Gammaproteobacteria bacterium]
MAQIQVIALILLLSPLLGCLIAGLLGKVIGIRGCNIVTIGLMAVSFALSCYLFDYIVIQHNPALNFNVFSWAVVNGLSFNVGFLIDNITVFMMLVVNFVSLLVHIYSMGYMEGDSGYQRFFSYISGFTFAMLSLVMANNFLLLFFGWEGVGLVSYLLIGFWFKRESANYASLKAFIANRVGDVGFLLGLAAILMYFGSLDYAQAFAQVPTIAAASPAMSYWGLHTANVITMICLFLFVGAIGKSAQVPLHIWLEGSMEGPTPISALIHAATMVTAGVFMVARLSPLFEFSEVALSSVLIIGSITALFMGIIGIVQTDIKRVVAYSTLSQLGYMMAAQGVSAYSIGLFHLMTHAAFKALLFLAAGSVIIGMHHEQDMRKMGGLRKYMPITYWCMLLGALALCAIPPFSGFYSKDLIIEAVQNSTIHAHKLCGWMLVAGTFVTALYTFRMFFMVFHGKERMTEEQKAHLHESPLSILIPLIALSIPTFLAGMIFFEPALNGFFGNSIFVLPQHNVVGQLQQAYTSSWQFLGHGIISLPFLLALLGIAISYVCYVLYPQVPDKLSRWFSWLYLLLKHKYGIDAAYDFIFGGGSRVVGFIVWRIGDVFIIDKGLVNGSAKSVRTLGNILRKLQSGYLYHYAFAVIVGLSLMLGWLYLQK